jgi:hypothetical protein
MSLMSKGRHALSAVALLSLSLPVSWLIGQEQDEGTRLAVTMAALEAEIATYEAENEIENLQRIFGFYIDKNLWTQAADLFSDDATLELGGSGVYRGKARILQYLQTMGPEGPQEGLLNDQMQLQPVVHVYPDGTARGRWHLFSQEAQHGEYAQWGTGIYENTYVLEDGVWKISAIHLFSTMKTPYADGWAVTALPRSEPDTALPPDQPPTMEYQNYPAVFIPPFHYGNPVTAPYDPLAGAVVAVPEPGALAGKLAELEQRAGRLADADAVERLHTIYGYYLARNQWDDLAGIFAEDGTIEIALRGVYRGRDSVRRNLDLYGVQGELDSTLHNHMQYQPVIHIAPDGQTAQMRSRAFSMMGSFGGAGTWMGGTYENIFEKRNGVWQIVKDQQMNTYFANYDIGWQELVWRPAPGINPNNPPDEPPSTTFEMYPRPFLPPFHYANPVTGRE